MKELTNGVPEGFVLVTGLSDFSQVLNPMYIRYDGTRLEMGVLLNESHLNNLEKCHGGLYMTLMDFALSTEVCHATDTFVGTPTVSFSIDFMESARAGDFIWADTEVLKTTRTLAFTQGVIRCADKALARASATFKLPNEKQAEHAVTGSVFYKWATGQDFVIQD